MRIPKVYIRFEEIQNSNVQKRDLIAMVYMDLEREDSYLHDCLRDVWENLSCLRNFKIKEAYLFGGFKQESLCRFTRNLLN